MTDPNAANWLSLSKEIAHGEWQYRGWEYPSPVPIVRSASKPKKPPVRKVRQEPQWCWDNQKEVKRLLRKLGLYLSQVFPEAKDFPRPVRRLPYGGGKYQPWERIEAGLQNLASSTTDLSAVEKPTHDMPTSGTAQGAAPDNAGGQRKDFFITTDFQKRILAALDGKALMKDALADACKCEGSRLYKRNGIKELMERGLVRHQSGIGYYRPDAPPPEAIPLSGN